MLSLDDVYGAEYLSGMRPRQTHVFVPDPSNAFNANQSFEATRTFGVMVQGGADRALHGPGGFAPAAWAPMVGRLGTAQSDAVPREYTRGVILSYPEAPSLSALRRMHPGLMPRPTEQFFPQWLRVLAFDMQGTLALLSVGYRAFKVRVRNAESHAAIPKVQVQLVLSSAKKLGVEVATDRDGIAHLLLPDKAGSVEALIVQPKHSYWPVILTKPKLAGNSITIEVPPLKPKWVDTLRSTLPPGAEADGAGVRVGVIDSGIGPHRNLVVAGGANLVPVAFEHPSDANSFLDNGIGHGTHVAGIIAGRGRSGWRGLAPAAELFSYRVYAKGSFVADDPAVAEALETAVEAGCHLINVSLGSHKPVREISDALLMAAARGCVVIAAAGNDGRKSVQFPANHPGVIAVGALGDRERMPPGTLSVAAFQKPIRGRPPGIQEGFIGKFSNEGPELDLAGPGVGVISTFPGNKFAVCDGTSMAAPAITGWAARLLSKNVEILRLPATQLRTEAISRLIYENAAAMGFGDLLEGQGVPT